jgi:flagellar biosynthesis/type III secretory pathway protein FliH
LQELAMMSPVFEKAKKALEALSGRPDVQEIARERELALLTYKLELGEARREGERAGLEQGERVGREQGERAGRVTALLGILAARRLELSAEVRGRITACTDVATLDKWITRAVTAQSAAEVIF